MLCYPLFSASLTLLGIAGPAGGGAERAVPEGGHPQVLASIAVGATGAAISLV